jgi:hypothetical protein
MVKKKKVPAPKNAPHLLEDYDEASENIVTMKDILKLYLYMERLKE